jgi:hypothetical protein
MSFVDILLVVVICGAVIALVAWDLFNGANLKRQMRRTGDEMRRQNRERDVR